MRKEVDFKIILLSSFEDKINKKEIYLEHIEDICKNTEINKDIINFFINNNGNIEDLFKNITILTGDECYVLNDENNKVKEEDFDYYNHQLILPNNLELKNNVINENMLYNIAYYCTLNNFKAENLSKNPYKIDVFHINNNLFDKKIMIKNKYETSLFIEHDVEDTIPEYCDPKFLTFDEFQDLIYNVSKELDIFNIDYADHSDYIVEIEIELTDCLATNIKLIGDFVNQEYLNYMNKINKLKKDNKKYFKKQLTQKKLNKF